MVLANVGWSLIPAGSQISLMWLPAGWAATAFWRVGHRAWLPLFIAGVADAMLNNSVWSRATILAASNAAAGWVFAASLRTCFFNAAFAVRRDVTKFVVAAVASSLFAALCGVGLLWGTGRLRSDTSVINFFGAWTLSNLIGIVLFAPWLEISPGRFRRLVNRWGDLLLIIGLVGVFSWLAFYGESSRGWFGPPALVGSTLVVLFAALRLGKEGAMLAVLAFCVAAALATTERVGAGGWLESVVGGSGGRLLLLWSYACTLALTALLVTALEAERETAVVGERIKAGHISTALSAIGDAVVTTSSDERITWINELAVLQLGLPKAADAVGKPLSEVLHLRLKGEREAMTTAQIATFAREGHRPQEFLGWLGTVERVPVEFRVSAFARRAQEQGGIVLTWRDISPELRREREAQATNERLTLALAASGACTWELDMGARRIRLDERWAGLIGSPDSGPIETDWQNIVDLSHPEERPAMAKIHREMIFRGQDDYLVEQRVRTFRGEWIWIESRGKVVRRDSKGRALRVIGTNIDISARKTAEFRLQAQNAFLESLQLLTFELVEERAMAPLFDQVLKSAQHILRADFGVLMLRTCDHLEVKAVNGEGGMTLGDRFAREESELAWRVMERGKPIVVANSQGRPAMETGLVAADDLGAVVNFPIMAQGQCLGVLGVARRRGLPDFSLEDLERGGTFSQMTALVLRNADSHEAVMRMANNRAAALAESEVRFRTVFDHSPVGQLLTSQPDGKIVEVNTGALQLVGLKREDVMGRNIRDLQVMQDPDDHQAFFAELRAHGLVDGYECDARRHTGEIVSVSCYARRVQVDGHECVLTTIIDISERRRAEQRFHKLFEYSPDAMLLATWDGRIIESNRGARTLLGCSRNELMASHCLDLVAGPDGEKMRRMLKVYQGRPNFRRRGLTGVEFQARGIDGREFPAHLRLLELPTGDTSVVVATLTDLTHRRGEEMRRDALENQLRRVQKMDALGTLAGGVAHDFNNLLTAIIGYAELALMDLGAAHGVSPMVDRILEAANRSRDLVAQILTFSRREETQLVTMKLQPPMRDAVKLLRATIPAMVTIESVIPDDCPAVRANHTQIYQIVMNLGTNAWHALRSHGGTIRILLESLQVDAEHAQRIQPLQPGSYVRLSVEDSGPGISAEILERIFDPFFTTKGPGEGTGLGLSVVHGIVASHGGAIFAENLTRGACFRAYFPTAEQEAEPVPETEDALLVGEGESVLLLDDDTLTGDTLAAILKTLNYRVRWRQHPKEALQAVFDEGERFDIIITDLALPTMSGLEFAEKVMAVLPDQRMLLLSGNVTGDEESAAARIGMRAVLRKPIELPVFSRAIKAALHGAGNASAVVRSGESDQTAADLGGMI